MEFLHVANGKGQGDGALNMTAYVPSLVEGIFS